MTNLQISNNRLFRIVRKETSKGYALTITRHQSKHLISWYIATIFKVRAKYSLGVLIFTEKETRGLQKVSMNALFLQTYFR